MTLLRWRAPPNWHRGKMIQAQEPTRQNQPKNPGDAL